MIERKLELKEILAGDHQKKENVLLDYNPKSMLNRT